MKRTNFKTLLAGMALSAVIGLGAADTAQASVVTFDSHSSIEMYPNAFDEGGLHFEGYEAWFFGPGFEDGFPTALATPIMETWIEPLVITRAGGGVFDLQSLALALGQYNPTTPGFHDTTTVVGQFASGGSITAQLSVGYGFQTYALSGFTGLSSVTFGTLSPQTTVDGFVYSGFLAFDDITYAGAPVPEPAAWTMMILGFAGLGGLLRRRRATYATA